jgi:hypothetical protein
MGVLLVPTTSQETLKPGADNWGMSYLQSGASAASLKYGIVNSIVLCRVLRGTLFLQAASMCLLANVSLPNGANQRPTCLQFPSFSLICW